ncbi:hypothetical protein KM043_005484 [Ampulex compressa]|nr:hypothetical protein KM043_005484 [Ampulex compressa]
MPSGGKKSLPAGGWKSNEAAWWAKRREAEGKKEPEEPRRTTAIRSTRLVLLVEWRRGPESGGDARETSPPAESSKEALRARSCLTLAAVFYAGLHIATPRDYLPY